ncbi:SWIM zinc finger domain protein [Nitzschia inconspicua]|uniref:SWIM zinc finger domain protein n=1 Tax=Nitzschia inconspicua TaxID=303405 RepID=A0A9K3KCL8_9STRA|nr:SWIM zinc finger domain protein [Nitzschia inconspicua]
MWFTLPVTNMEVVKDDVHTFARLVGGGIGYETVGGTTLPDVFLKGIRKMALGLETIDVAHMCVPAEEYLSTGATIVNKTFYAFCHHLTEYCLMKAKEEWNVAETLVVVHANMDPGEWWVFKEHHPVGGVTTPPGYTRLRRVMVVHQNFLWCSCGLPSRMNYPCQHIYAVTKQVSMNMFGVRWHSQFQHHYGRDGAEDWTGVFDSMMADEFERD